MSSDIRSIPDPSELRNMARVAIQRGYRLRAKRRVQIAGPVILAVALAIGLVIPSTRFIESSRISPAEQGRTKDSRSGPGTTVEDERTARGSGRENAQAGWPDDTTDTEQEQVGAESPIDGRVAFVSERDGNPEIYVMDATGTNQKRLTDSVATDDSPSWSPDGHRIAFASNRTGAFKIYSMDADGSNVRVIGPSEGEGADPAWSPDGKQIAFSLFDGSFAGGPSRIWVMDADGDDARPVSPRIGSSDEPGRAIWPSWSPDGRRIAYTAIHQGHRIFTVGADGSDLKLLENGYGASWSPDGRRLAFIHFDDFGDFHPQELAVMDTDGNIEQVLVHSEKEWLGHPSWSPSGDRILFDRDADGHHTGIACDCRVGVTPGGADTPEWTSGSGPSPSSLWTVFVDGGKLFRLRSVNDHSASYGTGR